MTLYRLDRNGRDVTNMPGLWDESDCEVESSQRFPLQPIEFSGGMVISLAGVLGRASDQCRRSRDNKHLVFPLTHLEKHINHLRESESDAQALERLECFLRLWVKE